MKAGNIIVYDLETGGFNVEKNGLAEIAMIALDLDTLEELGRYEAVIAPYDNLEGERMTYEPKALAVNGLTMCQIENGKPGKEVVKEIMAFAKAHKRGSKKPILAGHNIEKFDNKFLDYFFLCHKKDVTKHFENWFIDTMWWSAMKYAEKVIDHKLGTIAKEEGIRLSNAHSAMPDTEANAKLLINFIKGMRGAVISADTSTKRRTRTRFQF